MKVAIVLGTRPEVLKNYSIVKSLREYRVPFVVLHTGQHFDPNMQDLIFRSVGYMPDDVCAQPYSLGKSIDWLIDRLDFHGADRVLVNGDTAASIAGALAAIYSDRLLAHVEAGLRSYDSEMYEERNRIMVDAAAHYLFTYTSHEARQLALQKDLRGDVLNLGNTSVDLIADFSNRLQEPYLKDFAFLTLHRRELLQSRDLLLSVLRAIEHVAKNFSKVVFPVHPHTRNRMTELGIDVGEFYGIDFVDPMLPFDALSHIKHARLILTDSGVVQEEAYILNRPCVTIRNNTERHLSVKYKANIVAGLAFHGINRAVNRQLSRVARPYPNIYGIYGAGRRMVESFCNLASLENNQRDATVRASCDSIASNLALNTGRNRHD